LPIKKKKNKHTRYKNNYDYVMTFFDCTADLVGQLNDNGQKGMLQIDLSKMSGYATGTTPHNSHQQ